MTDEQQKPDSTDTPAKTPRSRRAATSKKKTPPPDAMGVANAASPADATSAAVAAEGAGEAPVKPRRTRRKTASASTDETAATPETAAESPAAAPKKAAPRRTRKAAADNADKAANADKDAAAPSTPPKRTRKPAARKKETKPAEVAAPVAESVIAPAIAAENAAAPLLDAAPAAAAAVDVTAVAASPAETTVAPVAPVAVEMPSAVADSVEAAPSDAVAAQAMTTAQPEDPSMPSAQTYLQTPQSEDIFVTPEALTSAAEADAENAVAKDVAVETADTDGSADAEPAAEAASTDEADESADAATQGEARKSRRGRRGGRGRGRKKSVAEAASDAPQDADAADADEEEAAPAAPAPREARPKSAPAKNADVADEAPAKPGRRKMFISVVPGEQVEVALVEEGAIHEYYLEMSHQAKTKGNIYKGVIHNVDTNLQAAFVSYGTGKNGFLQIDEIHPEYYLTHHEAVKGKKFPPIQKVIKAGQEVLVQVVKEPTGNKGAFLTTWLSLAGRFLVLTPGQEQIGVSRKVDNDEERARLREMMNGIDPGEDLGVIVRTVSAGTSKTTLKNDLQYLKRVWKEIRRRATSEAAPFLVYKESGLAERAVRDYLTEDVCEVWVDNASVAESLRETVSLLFPRKEDLVRVHAEVRQTLWERFNIQRQLEQIYSREVTLPSGGRLVFDQTEALMAIDINSGKISGKGNFESMALKTNLEAAEAIARHLKLRDIGGQVVIDFIEMRDKNHVRDVEKVLRNTMKNDRARHDIGRMSSFGLLEIVRQRTGSSALAITMEPCPSCGGTGLRRNLEWQSLQALREIGRQARGSANGKCVFETSAELGMYLLNHKRDRLREMEQEQNLTIEIRIRP